MFLKFNIPIIACVAANGCCIFEIILGQGYYTVGVERAMLFFPLVLTLAVPPLYCRLDLEGDKQKGDRAWRRHRL